MFICLTGIDGCGKGTQITLLSHYLRVKGHRVFVSKAYGEGEKESFAPFIEYWSQLSILFLFQALHAHQREEAQKALAGGNIVIADKWDEAYVAYHSNYGLLATDAELRSRLNDVAFDSLYPEVTYLLDVSVLTAKERCRLRGEDFFDKAPLKHHALMREAYLALARERNWVVLDGEQTPQQIHTQVVAHIATKL